MRKRVNKTKEKMMMITFTIWFGTDYLANDLANHKYASSDSSVLERAGKTRRVVNASLSDICRYNIVTYGSHSDRGDSEFVKNWCGCHVTLKRVRLYLTCGCHVIINKKIYTRVLSRVNETLFRKCFLFSSTFFKRLNKNYHACVYLTSGIHRALSIIPLTLFTSTRQMITCASI